MVQARVVANAFVALLTITALAGCSSQTPETNSNLGRLEATTGGEQTKFGYVEVDPDSDTTGAVAGIVLTESGNPIPGALVTILSVDGSTTTNGTGQFTFTNVAKGEQQMRVEKDGYKTLQRHFSVVAGKIVEIEAILARVDGQGGGFVDHYHDHWAGQQLYTVYDGRIEFHDDVTAIPPTTCAAPDAISGHGQCRPTFQLQPEPGRIVPPGTIKLTFDISFEPGPLWDQELLELTVFPPVSPSGVEYAPATFTVADGSEHFEYELPDPALVDYGHARRTNWRFELYDSNDIRDYTWASPYNSLFKGPIDVTITAHKGDLLIDPPHPRYWDNRDNILLDGGIPGYVFCQVGGSPFVCDRRSPEALIDFGNGNDEATCRHPEDFAWGCIALNRRSIVPSGTSRLEFDVEIWRGRALYGLPNLPSADDLVVGLKTAAASSPSTWDDYAWVEPTATFTPAPMDGRFFQDGRHYSIAVHPNDVDDIYAYTSQWIFQLALRGHERATDWTDLHCPSYACGAIYFELSNIVAHNDSAGNQTAAP